MEIFSSSIDELCKNFDMASVKETHDVATEVATQKIFPIDGNLISSFLFVTIGDCRFNIGFLVGVAGSDKISSAHVDEYVQDLATALDLFS